MLCNPAKASTTFWILGLVVCTPVGAATLTVEVSDFQSAVGNLNVAVYTDGATWLKSGKAAARQSVAVSEALSDGTVTLEFELEPGDYAVVVHHDDNDNGKLDTNFIGIPTEPTGTSNGEAPRFGPPRFQKAVFKLDEGGIRVPIRLRN